MTEETVFKGAEAGKMQRHSSWPAYLIIGIGLLLLAANLFDFELMAYLWPGFIIAPGVLLMWPAYTSTPEKQNALSFLAVPGAILATTGIMLFMMNVTDHFEAWAYSWPFIWASVAWGIMYMKRFDPNNKIHESGRKFIRIMFFLFGALMIFFEIIIWGNFNPLLALGLVAYGVYLLWQNQKKS